MCDYLVGRRNCKIPTKETYCHIHRNMTLRKKIKLQSDEITILNRKLSESIRKLRIIEQADLVKYKLAPFIDGRSFRKAIDDLSIKKEIEEIFDAPQRECINIYNELINKRNMLVHKYTSRDWKLQKTTDHGINIKQLCSSIKAYSLLHH